MTIATEWQSYLRFSFLFCNVLWGPLIMLWRFLHQKHHNLEVKISDLFLTPLIWTLCLNRWPSSYWRSLDLYFKKVNSRFLNIGIRRKATQTLFFHNLALQSVLLPSEPSLSFGFCVGLHSPLVIYTMCVKRWAGLNRQQCTFTFMHLADAFIQSNLHCIQVTVLHFISSCFPWESNPWSWRC